MQISVEETSELGRKMTIQLPEEVVQKEMNKRLQSMVRDAKLPGFRPGKVPLSIIKKRYGAGVRDEVMGELVRSSFSDAINERKLNPAAPASIEPVDSTESEGLQFIASFEVLPEVTLVDLSQIEVKRPLSEVKASDLDAVIEKVREQRKIWNSVERTAESDDRVTIHFTGETEDGPFTKEKVENFPVILGSGSMVPGFEDQLIGGEAGQQLSFEVVFPEEYGNEELAGKTATFEVEVVKIEASELPELDEAFIKSFDIEDGNVEAFRDQIKESLEYQMNEVIKGKVKSSVIDALLEHHTFTLPEGMVAQEVTALYSTAQENMKQRGQTLEMTDEQIQTEFKSAAQQRVQISMIFGKILGGSDLTLDQSKVGSAIEALAENYQDPESVIELYQQNAEMRGQLERVVLEEQVVEWVLGQAKVVDEPIDFSELMPAEQLGG